MYDLDKTVENLKDLKNDIAETAVGGSSYDNYSTTERYPEGSTTERTAIRILTNNQAYRMTKTINCINEALQELDEEKLELYQKKYRDKKSWQKITMDMNISQATYFRWRNDIVYAVAKKMGFK